jgi:DNA replication protein DnaC
MTHTLPDGTVIGEDCRAALRVARSADQGVVLRHVQPLGNSCINCGGESVLWFAFLRGRGSRRPIGSPGTPVLYDNGLWWQYDSHHYDCPVCNESNTDRSIRLWEASGLAPNERAWKVDFINGRLDKGEALEAAHELLGTLPRPAGWVSFFGPFGVGKTGLLKSMVAACIRVGTSARYARALDILSEARGTYGDNSAESEQALIARYARYQFLAIDEVDRASGTEWARSMLFNVLDDRYTRRDTVATAIATNSTPGHMDEMWGYLESRMRDGARVIVGGDDLRGG